MKNIFLGFIVQVLSFIPFYIIWKKDSKKIGKENLALDLLNRFVKWMLYFPAWLIGLVK